ncbi:hypothetical protein SAMN06296020_10286 [Anoxynatronum buryatiense]|uniref:Uncharacterized protein n=1 Tax=Anoxynatronum buryatiense TaxID=489973 RepID=A0AA45WTP8_9CLOT|nr:hypothetical protein SAMN06296020_10286 [Anoxynatronum buryatiense]
MSLDGKIFVELIALTYLSHVKMKMQDAGLFTKWTLQGLLDELDAIVMMSRLLQQTLVEAAREFFVDVMDYQEPLRIMLETSLNKKFECGVVGGSKPSGLTFL